MLFDFLIVTSQAEVIKLFDAIFALFGLTA